MVIYHNKKRLKKLNQKKIRCFKKNIISQNPISFQVLGLCSALAVTGSMNTALAMFLTLSFVLISSNLIVSLIRNYIPHSVRIITFLIIISTLVIVADEFLRAFFFDISKHLSIFTALIITNCLVMGRAEIFASKNTPKDSLLDALSNSLGYGLYLILIASIREILGNGTFFNIGIIPDYLYQAGYKEIIIMKMPAIAFFLIGLIIWAQKTFLNEENKK